MKKIILVAVMIGGCTNTTGEMRASPPYATYVSQKSVAALEQCLADPLSWSGTPTIIRGEAVTSIAVIDRGNTNLLVTLSPGPNGVTVEVRQQFRYLDRTRKAIILCL